MSLVLNSDIIDSRDIIEEIEDLESMLEDKSCGEEDIEMLDELRRVEKEVEGYNSDWKYGVTLIHERYWQSYAMDLAYDTGALQTGQIWPLNCVDWEQAAKELAYDYSIVEIDGEDYYFLSC